MLQNEITEILDAIEDFWPNTKPSILGLIAKDVQALDYRDVKAAIEETRRSSNYSTLPYQKLTHELRKKKKSGISGSLMTCYALHESTGKGIECIVVAMTSDGAKIEMVKYLERWGMKATDYIIFPGEENHNEFRRQQFETKAALNPAIRKTAECLLRVLMGGGTMADISKRAFNMPQKPYVNTGVKAKQMIDAVKGSV